MKLGKVAMAEKGHGEALHLGWGVDTFSTSVQTTAFLYRVEVYFEDSTQNHVVRNNSTTVNFIRQFWASRY